MALGLKFVLKNVYYLKKTQIVQFLNNFNLKKKWKTLKRQRKK